MGFCQEPRPNHDSKAPATAARAPLITRPAELVLDCRNVLGESPVWCARQNVLYWVDIDGRSLHRFDPLLAPAPEAHRSWPLPDRPGCVALTKTDGRLLLAFATGVCVWEQATGRCARLGPFEPDLPTTRMNDGRADRDGRLVVGGYNEAHSTDGGRAISGLYRVGTDGRITRLLPEGIRCANSICFSPDGRHMYFTDSPTRAILRFDYPPPEVARGIARDAPPGADNRNTVGGQWERGREADNGRGGGGDSRDDPVPCNPRVFYQMPAEDPAIPDGSTIDAEGGLWNAQFRGSQVIHHRALDGVIDIIVPVPVPNVTSVSLGGPDLKTLFITTARKKMSQSQLAAMPTAGGLFAIKVPSAAGLPEPRCWYDEIS